jgi:hypothetical protein
MFYNAGLRLYQNNLGDYIGLIQNSTMVPIVTTQRYPIFSESPGANVFKKLECVFLAGLSSLA